MGSRAGNIIMKTLCILVLLFTYSLAQLKFGNSASSVGNKNTKQKEVDTKFFTGNEAIDGGIVGLGAGLLGGAVLGSVLGGGNNGCGRRRRQADETGRRWCYTTGYGCQDARQSQRYPNNPWSYVACPNNAGSRRTGS